MDNPVNPAVTAALNAHRVRAAEQLVRDQVLADTFRNLPASTARQQLEASHYALMSSASPLAINAALRHQRESIKEGDLQQAGRHYARFSS